MAKELVKYSKITAAKGSMKKWYVGMGKKATAEQKFLGKTLPKALLGAAKFAFKHPITTAVGAVGLKKLGQTVHLKFPKERKWTKSIKGRYLL
jgi:hypothetical protein